MNGFNRLPTGSPANKVLSGQPGLRPGILLVARESDRRQLDVNALADASYRVEIAEDGAAAWAAVRVRSCDLVITEQFLPKLSGVALVKKIYAAKIAVRVIMATGILPTWEFVLQPCLQAVTMLRIPYSTSQLLDMVKCVLLQAAGGSAKTESAAVAQSQPSADSLRLCV